ncbi:MAG: ABC transporter ATP-binding protein [Desulfovibrio sp.]|jgi:iron complex transport system ATP-binding protein|nr:ABC transporter ATP-binding protein [Desulfovibrio sp.]
MLRIQHFSFALNGNCILENLSFSLAKGEYLSVIGPNGAGKSTLLKCIIRVHEHGSTRGEIHLKGRLLSEYDQRTLSALISYVPQAGGWIPPFTVAELLRLSRYPYLSAGGALRKTDLDAVEKALDLTGMKKLASRPLPSLSGGERQKAFVAAALAQDTEIILLDEPASFLDPKHTAELNRLVRVLNREHGITMLTVTHDLNHPLCMEGKVLVLRQGQQLFFGQAQEVLRGKILEDAFSHQFTCFQHPKTGRPTLLAEE